MSDAIAVLKTGKPSESRRKLMFELLAELTLKRISLLGLSTYMT